MVGKVKSLVSRMRFKLLAIQNPDMQSKPNYGFHTTNSPPPLKELQHFEEDIFALAKNIQFRPIHNEFQSTMMEKIKDISASNEILVKADKTPNIYKVPVEEYKNLVKQNITAEYKKTNFYEVKKVNIEAANLASNLDISDRVDQYIEADAFVTIKDHKPAFPGRVECHLLNPAKSNIGRISKQILEEAIDSIKSQTKSNLWSKSSDVISWFKNVKNKHSTSFLKFDVVSFYPSI